MVKPDQLIKRRGKLGLVGVDLSLAGVGEWLEATSGRCVEVGAVQGSLTNFICEPFVPHTPEEEFYLW